MTPTDPDLPLALSEEEARQLAEEATAAELTPDEFEKAHGLVADGAAIDAAVAQVLEERDPEDAAEPETPEQAPPAPTAEEMEAIFSALEKQAVKHRERVLELAGPLAADLAPCPLCQEQAPGFYLHDLPPDQAEGRIQAIVGVLSGGIVPEYRVSEQVERCDACDGWGRVLSGSRVPEQATVPCTACTGSGHKPKLEVPGAPPPLPEQPAPQPHIPGADNGSGLPDAWGRPVGHPHYNIHPAMVGA